ncbi:MAG: hypothetical protein ABJD07_13540 [Gemmatimonadaceae bacterium]
MSVHSPHRARRPRAHTHQSYDYGDIAIIPQVQNGLNLGLRLKTPAQMPALAAIIAANSKVIDDALSSLHYVHFARFLPTPDYSALQVVTVYDGDLQSYLMDFVAVLGPIFNAVLDFVQDAPRLPVERYPQDFIAFVNRNNMSSGGVWSAYPLNTVIDILAPSQVR